MTSKGKVDYQKGLIYAIYSKLDCSLFYIGSTTNLKQRWKGHKDSLKDKTKNNSFLYQKMLEDGIENFYIELIEYCPCQNKQELQRYEGIIQRKLNPPLNKNIAGQTRKEYREKNIEKFKAKEKKFRDNNKEYYKEYSKSYNKNYYEENKEKIKEHKKKYREEKKEQIREIQRKYREENKEKIQEYQKNYRLKNQKKVKKHLLKDLD